MNVTYRIKIILDNFLKLYIHGIFRLLKSTIKKDFKKATNHRKLRIQQQSFFYSPQRMSTRESLIQTLHQSGS